MRVAYLDCFAGISGDMFLGALIDAGVDPAVLEGAAAALGIGASLKVERVDRSGITATKVHVLEGGELAEASADGKPEGSQTHSHSHAEASAGSSAAGASASSHGHGHAHADADSEGLPEQQSAERELRQTEPKTQHLHKGGHSHDHSHDHGGGAVAAVATEGFGKDAAAGHEDSTEDSDGHAHEHHHGRSLTVIREMIRGSALAGPVKDFAVRTFELLGASEAKIHNVPVDEIHFHEVGAVDAIVDIVAASAGIHALNEQAVAETGEPVRWYSSALNVGGGMVDCAHGRFPVPAPATADLLKGMPTYSADMQKELVTPTGAALVRALAPSFGAQPAMRVSAIGYGAGTRNPKGFPNVLRLSIGETAGEGVGSDLEVETGGLPRMGAAVAAATEDFAGCLLDGPVRAGSVTVLETAIDDLSPQILAYVTERALAMGALDVMTTAVGMKKGRAGTLVTILCEDARAAALEGLLLRETSTLGVRTRVEQRSCLDRSHTVVETVYGAIRVKVGSMLGEELNAAPEFEDCRAAAVEHGVAVKLVMQAAVVAYAGLKAKE